MQADLNCDLIAYQFDKNQYTLNPVEISGEKDEDKFDFDKLKYSSFNPALLVIENDIINKNGYGLKKGFYNVTTDKYLDFLYILQQGKLKAKIPVAKMQVFETLNPIQPKVKKMSYRKFLNQQQKEKQKYMKGENPAHVDFKEASIEYIKEQNAYILIYRSNNIELTGVIKL